ncbi:MAG: lipoate-protein ligase B [uncultured bacterium]|nr:MAG: lipoate-protein ligase B [uncultured bacterium]
MQNIAIHDLGLSDYQEVWQKMQSFTDSRDENTNDEIWLLEHPPVFTQGLAGKAEHILNPHHIPIIQTDRGGQVTYHGPGQLILYPLINIKRKEISPRELVTKLENSVIMLLAELGIQAQSRCGAPGVYVDHQKICSIGLRIRKGCSYHGIALNVDMDLKPFDYINPCGYKDLKMTQIKNFFPEVSVSKIKKQIISIVLKRLISHRD